MDTGEASMLKIDENLETESVISSNPPCKDRNAIFTTIPLIPSFSLARKLFNSDHLSIASYKQEMHRSLSQKIRKKKQFQETKILISIS